MAVVAEPNKVNIFRAKVLGHVERDQQVDVNEAYGEPTV